MSRKALLLTAILLMATASVCAQSVSLDHVGGAVDGILMTGRLDTFYVRLSNELPVGIDGITNGFSVNSPDGATWTTAYGDTIGGLGMTEFDGGFFFPTFGVNGQGADTVAFGAFRFFGPGLAPGYNEVALGVIIGPIDESSSGKTICLDSAYFPPSGVWMWSSSGAGSQFPSWPGPYCYTVEQAIVFTDTLFLSTHHLAFTMDEGGPLPPAQVVATASSGDPLDFAVSVTTGLVNVQPASGTTPDSLVVSILPPLPPAGHYIDTIRIIAPSATNTIQYVTVDLTVGPGAPAITLDSVEGMWGGNFLTIDQPVTFDLRVTNDENSYQGIVNGFRVYSPNGADWNTTVGDTTGTIGMSQFDLIFVVNDFGVTGSGADTVMFGGASMMAGGLQPNFNDVAYTIQIGPIDSVQIGKTICLDSSWSPPTGDWLWSGQIAGTVRPAWDGPHCFTVQAPPPSNLIVTSNILAFTKNEDGPNPPSQFFGLASDGVVPLNFSITPDVPWLHVSPESGTTPASLEVWVEADALPVGDYTGNLVIESPNALNSPVAFTVYLTVEPGLTAEVFRVGIIANTFGELDVGTFGVLAEATDGFDPTWDLPESPAPPGDWVRVYFPHPEWGQFQSEFDSDIRYLLGQECKEWEVVVETSNPTEVDMSFVPTIFAPMFNVTLFSADGNLISGNVMNEGYHFFSEGGPTHFRIRVCDYPVYDIPLRSGWSLISSPIEPRDPSPDAVFGDDLPFWQVYGWDHDHYYTPAEFHGNQHGYWLLAPNSATIDVEGSLPPEVDTIVFINLHQGWNLIGCPFDFRTDYREAVVDSAGEYLILSEAVSRGWVSPVFYAWALMMYTPAMSLEPGYGFWFASLVDNVRLGLAPIPYTDLVAKETPLALSGALELTLAYAGGSITIGFADGATDGFDASFDLPAPPPSPIEESSRIMLTSDLEMGFGEYTRDIRESGKSAEWPILVEADYSLDVTTSGIARVTGLGYAVSLRDLATGAERSLEEDAPLTLYPGEYILSANYVGHVELPQEYYLAANYPNPFNPNTTIEFGLPHASEVTLAVYNILGQRVSTLVNGRLEAGNHQVAWQGQNDAGEPVSTGIYFYRLTTPDYSETQKMMLMK